MRSHRRSSRSTVFGRPWRALLLTLGLGLPAAAGPRTPEPAAPCTPEALFLGKGQRDFADTSELLGGDGAPDLVLAVRGCTASVLRHVEISAEDGTVLWDTRPDNDSWTVSVAARQTPEQLLQYPSGELLRTALVWRTTPQGAGAELVLSVSGESPRGQAFQSKPQGKVTLSYADGASESIPLQPAPSPLPPALAPLMGSPPLDAAAVLRDFAAEDVTRQRTAIPRLSEAVTRLEPQESLPVLKLALFSKSDRGPDDIPAAAARALRLLGPRALPAAPALVQTYLRASYPPFKAQLTRALSAMGPDVAPAILGMPPQDSESSPSGRKELLDALEPTDERLVRLFRALVSDDASAAKQAEALSDCKDAGPAFFARAAKNRATVKEASRLLEHSTPRIRHLAAGVLLASGERAPAVRREVKWGALECGEGFARLLRSGPKEDPREGVFLAGSTGMALVPRLVYRQGGWEPVLLGLVSGPSEWFPILPEAAPIRTQTKAIEYTGSCGTPYQALPLLNQEPPNPTGFALSKKTEARPIAEAPAELQSAIQGVLKAQAPDESRLLAKQLRASSWYTGEEDPTTLWREIRPPQDAPARCLAVTASEWLCHTSQGRELRSKAEPNDPLASCQSRFWLRGSVTAMRIIQASRECTTEGLGDLPPPVVEARGALMLEGRAWWLMSVRRPGSDGIGDGDELWGPRGNGMERVASLSPHLERCD
ncbi:hypothetical protein NR798_31915 [Archangium gephyra]|uniref:hypothetical protein n=1 Tax=Archangium gephyra TaxID=48 RepID=UPI0035D513E6